MDIQRNGSQPSAAMVRRSFLKNTVAIAFALPAVGCARVNPPSTKGKEFIMEMKNIDVAMVAPVLKKYAEGPLHDLWKRPGLTPRDRGIVTLAALIARNQTTEI